jgi:hypothetical protein
VTCASADHCIDNAFLLTRRPCGLGVTLSAANSSIEAVARGLIGQELLRPARDHKSCPGVVLIKDLISSHHLGFTIIVFRDFDSIQNYLIIYGVGARSPSFASISVSGRKAPACASSRESERPPGSEIDNA